MPRITVIMPVWNAAKTLERAVSGILGQEFEDWELVAVNDGSSDGSGALLDGLAEQDGRMRVLKASGHRGVVAAHGAGLKMATGELIARMDADDWSDPRRLLRQVEMLDSRPELGAVSCRVRLLDPLGDGMRRHVEWANSLTTPGQISAGRFIEAPMVHPSAVIRREWIDRVDGYRDMGWPEDYDLWLRLLDEGCRMAKVDEELFHWQDREHRLTRQHPDYASDAVWRMKAHFLARLPRVVERGVALCGAGPIGRRMTGLLQRNSIEVRAIFDVDPAKVGRQVKGVPVLGHEEFGKRERDAVLLSAVGVVGGRQRVRALAAEVGYVEGEDFWCVC
jgi:glycosyltransferase involved in cell wall biosynthesis